MSTFSSTLEMYQYPQTGLSGGSTELLPMAGAMWRRVRLQPFNLGNPETPEPTECQLWPRGIRQGGELL